MDNLADNLHGYWQPAWIWIGFASWLILLLTTKPKTFDDWATALPMITICFVTGPTIGLVMIVLSLTSPSPKR